MQLGLQTLSWTLPCSWAHRRWQAKGPMVRHKAGCAAYESPEPWVDMPRHRLYGTGQLGTSLSSPPVCLQNPECACYGLALADLWLSAHNCKKNKPRLQSAAGVELACWPQFCCAKLSRPTPVRGCALGPPASFFLHATKRCPAGLAQLPSPSDALCLKPGMHSSLQWHVGQCYTRTQPVLVHRCAPPDVPGLLPYEAVAVSYKPSSD